MKKRLLSIILLCVMLFQLLSVGTLAAGQSISVGQHVAMGKKDGRDLTWEILAIEDGLVLLFSDYVLDFVAVPKYNSASFNYCDSVLFEWCDNFCNTSFTEDEKKAMLSTPFFMNKTDASKYVKEQPMFWPGLPETYIGAQGLGTVLATEEKCGIWLSSSLNGRWVDVLAWTEKGLYFGTCANLTMYTCVEGACPAMTLELDKVEFVGKGTFESPYTLRYTGGGTNVEDFETIETIRIRTGGEGNQEYDLPNVVWKDNWFSESATTYNHELAKTALALSSAAYGRVGQIFCALEQFGFDYTNVNYLEDDADYGGNYDQVSYALASKQIACEDGEYTLVAVVVRGTPGNGEWYSNFNISVDDTHRGFNNAEYDLEQNLKKYLKTRGVSKDNVKFLVTGHSRGAAVANLLAADLIDDGYTNVFGYTFAAPAVSTKAKQAGYESIFNIINQEDFVTQIPLGRWKYKRYGVNLTLPSRSFYSSDAYDALYRRMNDEYVVIRKAHFTPYKGCQQVEQLSRNIYRLAPDVYEFYTTEHSYIYGLPRTYTCEEYFNNLAEIIITQTLGSYFEFIVGASNGAFSNVSTFFIENHALNPRVFSAHSQAGYLAWMRSCTSEELFGVNNKQAYPTYKQLTIACPVDIYVYNEAGTLVASVINEEVVVDTLAVSVQDGVKTIDLPADQEYRVEIKAREAGTVDYTVEEKSVDSAIDTTRTVFFDDISITKGDKLVGQITEKSSSQTYSLTKNNQTVITATSDTDAPSGLPFTDVTEKDWFYKDVKYVYENGLMNGVGPGLFGPSSTTTRGMIVTILYRLEGEPATALSGFQDVASNQWYAKAVGWAADNGIVTGYSSSQFGPNDKITREQMAAILYRYAVYKGYDVSQRADLSKYEDQGAISSYAVDSMAWANGEGLINGIDADTLNPKGSAIRAQVAAILHRFCENIA